MADLLGNLLQSNNNFCRQFKDDPGITAAANALPQMRRSRAVRDLRPAAKNCGHARRRSELRVCAHNDSLVNISTEVT